MEDDLHIADGFTVARVGDDWMIYRYCGTIESGDREALILTTDAMDGLRDYFAEFYAEDRNGAVV